MKKRISAILLALAVSVALAMGAAAESTTPTAVFTGSALTTTGDLTADFSGIVPGKTYSGSIELQNTSSETANFYVRTVDLQDLIGADAALGNTGYQVTVSCGSTTLYGRDADGNVTGTLVGSYDSATGLAELDFATQDEVLVATLAAGEKTTFTFSVTPDARARNSLQSTNGNVSFVFSAATVTTPVEYKTVTTYGQNTVVTVARTGDTNFIFIAAGLLALAVVVFLVAWRKIRKAKEEEKNA